jgi:hypothetical protein
MNIRQKVKGVNKIVRCAVMHYALCRCTMRHKLSQTHTEAVIEYDSHAPCDMKPAKQKLVGQIMVILKYLFL